VNPQQIAKIGQNRPTFRILTSLFKKGHQLENVHHSQWWQIQAMEKCTLYMGKWLQNPVLAIWAMKIDEATKNLKADKFCAS